MTKKIKLIELANHFLRQVQNFSSQTYLFLKGVAYLRVSAGQWFLVQMDGRTERAEADAAVQCWGLACRLLTDAKYKPGSGRERESWSERQSKTDGNREGGGETLSSRCESAG